MPLPARSARTASRTSRQRRPVADLDAERAGQLGVARPGPTAATRVSRKSTESTTYAVVCLKMLERYPKPHSAGRHRDDVVRCRSNGAHRGDASRRPPGRTRRRSGSGWRRPTPGCRRGTRSRTSPSATVAGDHVVPRLAGLHPTVTLALGRSAGSRYPRERSSTTCRRNRRRRSRRCCRRPGGGAGSRRCLRFAHKSYDFILIDGRNHSLGGASESQSRITRQRMRLRDICGRRLGTNV